MPPVREVEVDGVRLAYNDDGAGPAVVCLHAIGHGAGDFARLSARLRDRYRVLALDWPGQGRSDGDRVPPSARRYAELLEKFLDIVQVERAVIIGNSIGGAAAIWYAHAHPRRVRGLILENPGGLDAADDWLGRGVLKAMAAFFSAGARGARWFPAAFRGYYRLVLPRAASAAQRARIVAAGSELAPILAAAWKSFAQPEADLRALAQDVKCPVLFAWAARDRFIQFKRCEPAIRMFSNVRVEQFPAGHAAHLESPEAFEQSVERFLASLDAKSAAQ